MILLEAEKAEKSGVKVSIESRLLRSGFHQLLEDPVCVCLLGIHARALFWLDKGQGTAAVWLCQVAMWELSSCRKSTGFCHWWTGKENFPQS